MKFLAQLGILIAIPFLSTLKLHVMLLLIQIVKYFLDNKTFQKVKFVYPNNKDSVQVMKSYFDEENLPKELGGKSIMSYNHEEFSRLMVQDDLKCAAFWGSDGKLSNHIANGQSPAVCNETPPEAC